MQCNSLSEEHRTGEELSCHYIVPQINDRLQMARVIEETVEEMAISSTLQLSSSYLHNGD